MILCSLPGPWPPPSARAALAPWRSPDTRSLVVFPMAAVRVGGNLPRGTTPGGEHPAAASGASRPRPCAREGNPRRRRPRPGSPPLPTSGTPQLGNPLREPPPPCSTGPAHPRAAHLWRCAPGSRGHTHAGCSAYRETNKVVEIEAAPQVGDPGFLLKWLQGPRRGPASVPGPAHQASCPAPCVPAPPPVLP